MHFISIRMHQWPLFCAVLLAAGCGASPPSSPQKEAEQFDPAALPGIVARVDGVEITREQLIRRADGDREKPDATIDLQFLQASLDDLISAELLYQEAVARGFAIPEKELDTRISTIRARFPTQEAFLKTLEQQGMTLAGMRRNLGRDIAVSRYLDRNIISRISITEDEARQYYDENQDTIRGDDQLRVRHILIQLPENAGESALRRAREQLEGIQARIQAGADFGEMAREYSQDPGSAALGGELDWISRGTTVPAFDNAAYSLRTGEMSPIIRSRFGLHILQVTDRRPGSPVSYEEAKDQLLSFLRERRIEEQIGQRVAELRQKAQVEMFI